MKVLLIATALVALACADHHHNHTASSFDIKASFDLADANKDGVLVKTEFEALYNTFDDNGDGKINGTEFVIHFMKTGMSDKGSLFMFFVMENNDDSVVDRAEVDKFFDHLDKDDDGDVSLTEYTNAMTMALHQMQIAGALRPRLDTLFYQLDNDKDGGLLLSELARFITAADTNGNGELDPMEFGKFWMHHVDSDKMRTHGLFMNFDFNNDLVISMAEGKGLYQAMDYNHDNSVSEDEYINIMLYFFVKGLKQHKHKHMQMMEMKEQMEQMFKAADTDDNGMLSLAEEKAAHKKLDKNGDGAINITEYVSALMSMNKTKNAALYMFFLADKDHNNKIENSDIEANFNHADHDMDGEISMNETMKVAKKMHKMTYMVEKSFERIEAMTAAADADNNRDLTLAEMSSVLNGSDYDGDKKVSDVEFTYFWHSKTGFCKESSLRLFHIVDGDKDGFFTDAESKALYTQFDYDKNGVVSIDEFIGAMLYLTAQVSTDMLMDMMKLTKHTHHKFNMTDTDGDHMISLAEHMAAHKKADADSDGKISVKEFVIFATSMNMTKNAALFSFFRHDMNDDNNIDKSEMEAAFHHVDHNMDDQVCWGEMMNATKMMHHQSMVVNVVSERIDRMTHAADADNDDKLTGDEMWNTVSGGDVNGDKLLNETEFKHYWSLKTGLDMDRSTRLFKMLDADHNGVFGDEGEKKSLYNGFDYDKDKLVSREEFLNGILFMHAAVEDQIAMEMMMNGPMRFNMKRGFDMDDANKDGKISRDEFVGLADKFDDNKDQSVDAGELIKHNLAVGFNRWGSLYLFFRGDSNDDQKLVKSEIQASFDGIDADDDGFVTRDEYAAAMKKTLADLDMGLMTGQRLQLMYFRADRNMDEQLSNYEMRELLFSPDADKDGTVSEAEFKKSWMAATGEPEDRTAILFGILDADDDGEFGNDKEATSLFDRFDYGNDGMVSETEFLSSMLFLWTKSLEEVQKAQALKDVVGYFF